MVGDTEHLIKKGLKAYVLYKLVGWVMVAVIVPAWFIVAMISPPAAGILLVGIFAVAILGAVAFVVIAAIVYFGEG